MVYSKYSRKPKAARKIQRWVRKSRSARGQQGQIRYTNKRITRLQKRVKNSTRWVKQQLSLNGNFSLGVLTGSMSIQVVPLMPAGVSSAAYPSTLPAWSPWGLGEGNESPSISNCSMVRFGRLTGSIVVAASTEATPQSISLCIVSLQPGVSNQIWESRGADLQLDIFTTKYLITSSSQTFPIASQSGFPILVSSIFKTHWRRDFFLGNETYDSNATPLTNLKDSLKRFKFSIPLNYQFGNQGRSHWDNLAAEFGTKSQCARYLIAFSSNSTLDLGQSPTIDYIVHTTATGLV